MSTIDEEEIGLFILDITQFRALQNIILVYYESVIGNWYLWYRPAKRDWCNKLVGRVPLARGIDALSLVKKLYLVKLEHEHMEKIRNASFIEGIVVEKEDGIDVVIEVDKKECDYLMSVVSLYARH